MKALTGRLDYVFEATGIAVTINQGLQMVRKGGKVMVLGIHKDHATFDTIELVRQQKSLIGVYAYDKEIWQRCLTLMSSGKLDPTPIITHRLPLSRAVEAFELAVSRSAAKVVFIPET